jgi:hypothetical protein
MAAAPAASRGGRYLPGSGDWMHLHSSADFGNPAQVCMPCNGCGCARSDAGVRSESRNSFLRKVVRSRNR